ncbi:MAG TPA: porin family protein [Bacteroidales bacterium]|nr:porin family protein [Bacteroidales bacterium]
MRKWIFSLILIVVNLTVFQLLKAQSSLSGISIVGALSESRIIGNGNWSGSFITGGQAGMIFPVKHFSESLALRVEFNLSLQGSEWKRELVIFSPSGVPVNTAEKKGKLTLLYTNAPLTLRYQTKNRLFFESGIQFGYLIGLDNINYNLVTGYHNLPVTKSDFKSIDIGIPFEAGYEFKSNIGLGLRLYRGLSNINDYESTENNHNFVVSLRLTFNFRKKTEPDSL